MSRIPMEYEYAWLKLFRFLERREQLEAMLRDNRVDRGCGELEIEQLNISIGIFRDAVRTLKGVGQ